MTPLPLLGTLQAVFAELRRLPPRLWLRGLPLGAVSLLEEFLSILAGVDSSEPNVVVVFFVLVAAAAATALGFLLLHVLLHHSSRVVSDLVEIAAFGIVLLPFGLLLSMVWFRVGLILPAAACLDVFLNLAFAILLALAFKAVRAGQARGTPSERPCPARSRG